MKLLRALLAFFLLLSALDAAAHDFAFKDMNGREQRLSAYRGKWVLVNLWASWCAPCRAELPDLIALSNAHKNDLVVLGIAMDYPSANVVRAFVRKAKIPYPIILGDTGMADEIGPVSGLPTTFLFDPAGELAAHQAGPITRDGLETFMSAQAPASKK